MDEPFRQHIATLQKVQTTMGPQLMRLGQARLPDKVRLPRLHKEAGQLRGAAAALLKRMMQQEAGVELIRQAKSLVAFFAQAEQQAAALLKQAGQAGPDAAPAHDDEGLNETYADREMDEPASFEPASSDGKRSALGAANRGGRAAARLAKLGHSRDQAPCPMALPRRRSLI